MMNMFELMIRRSRQATPAIPTDYVFYAPFESDYADHSTYQRSMSYRNYEPTAYSTVSGIQCATVPANGSFYTTDTTGLELGQHDRTFACWFKVSGTSGSWDTVISYGYPSNNQTFQLVYYNEQMLGCMWGFDPYPRFDLDTHWHCYVTVYTASTKTFDFYTDGTLIASNSSGSALNLPSSTGIGIGAHYSGGNSITHEYNVAGVRIYDRVLTADEIQLISTEFEPTDKECYINPYQSPTFTNGTSGTMQLMATPSGCTFSTTSTLPSGVTLSPAGVVAYDGTPLSDTTSLTTTIAVTASKEGYTSYTANLTLKINVTQITIQDTSIYFVSEQSKTIQLTATPSGCTFSTESTLPSGVTLSSSGAISFDGSTIASDSTQTVAITASKQYCAPATKNFTITMYHELNPIVVEAELDVTATPTIGTLYSKPNAYTFTTLDGVDAMYCDGLTACTGVLYTPTRKILGNQPRTLSVWMYPTNLTRGQNWAFGFGSSNFDDIIALTINTSGKIHFPWGEHWQGALNQIDNPSMNAWTHIVLTYDSQYVKLYYNGVLQGTSNDASAINTSEKQIYVCGSWDSGSQWGQYTRNLKVWDTALTAQEVSDLYGLELPIFDGQASDSSSSGDISDSSSSGGGDPSLLWYTPFASDYEEKVNRITGVPTSNGICEIVPDSRFGGYLDMHKYSGSNLTGLQFPNTQNLLQLGTGDWSMSFWLNAPYWNSYGQAIISHRGNGTGFDSKDGFVLFKDSNYTMDMRIGANSNQAKSSNIPTDDTWHNWVFIHYSDGEWEWYMDGEYVDGGTGWGGNATSNGNVNVFVGGDGDWGKSAVFKLCHLRIYNRYLEYEEIEDMYHEFDDSSDSSDSSDPDLVIDAELATDTTTTVGTFVSKPSSFSFSSVDGVNALYGDGTGNTGLMFTPSKSIAGAQPRTFSVWMNPSGYPHDANAIYGHGSNSTYNICQLEAGQSHMHMPWGEAYDSPIRQVSLPQTGQWTHAVMVYDGTNVKLYFNGTLEATTNSVTFATSNTDVILGNRSGSNWSCAWYGYLRKFKVWDKALTAQEVSDLYDTEAPTFAPVPTDPLIVNDEYFTCTDGSGAMTSITAYGGTGSYTFSTSDTLPTGVTLYSDGMVEYDGTMSGNVNTSVTVTCSDGVSTETATLYIEIAHDQVSISDQYVTFYNNGDSSQTWQLYLDGGDVALCTWTYADLPSGVMDSGTDTIEYDGVSSTADTYTATVEVDDGYSSGTANVYITIEDV